MPIFDNDRINLLTDAEVKDLYARPEFTAAERKHFFSLAKPDYALLQKHKKLKPKVYFILQLGYFRAAKQFYKFSFEDAVEDITYIIQTYFDDPEKLLTGRIWKETYRQQKNDILALYKYNDWSSKYTNQVEAHLEELIKFYPKGNDTLRELFVYFENNKLVIPSYRTLQDLFSCVFKTETKRLNKIVKSIPVDMQNKLENLGKNDDGITQLNVIKVDQKDFQYNSLKSEIKKSQQIKELYQFGKQFIPSLNLSRNAVRYYAGVAEQYTASRIRKLSKSQQWLHVMCFVDYRYQQFMDNLITSFIYHVRLIMEAAKKYAEEQAAIHNANLVLDLPKVVTFLKWFPSEKLDPNTTYKEFSVKGFQILPKEQFPLMADFIAGKAFDKEAARWKFYEKSSRLFALYLRPIILAVDFEFHKPDSPTMGFINFLREHYSKGRSPATLKLSDDDDILTEKYMLPLLKSNSDNAEINPSRFEFYVYKKMYHQIDRGRLFCNDSVSYCSLDHDLVPDEVVDNVVAITNKFGYPKIPIYCDCLLYTSPSPRDATLSRMPSSA